MKTKPRLKRIILLLIILALLALAVSAICKRIYWAYEKSDITDEKIYTRWTDEFGFSFGITDHTANFKIYFPYRYRIGGDKYINNEGSKSMEISKDLNESLFSEVYSPVEYVTLTPEFFSDNGYTVPEGANEHIYTMDLITFIWQDRYLVLCHAYTTSHYADIYDLFTGQEYSYAVSTEHDVPDNIVGMSALFDPGYFATDDGMIFCIYKYYNSIYCAKLN